MQIDLPSNLIDQAKSLAGEGEDTAAVFAEALKTLAWERQQVAAVQEGIDAYKRGDYEPLEDFDRRFREEHGIRPDA